MGMSNLWAVAFNFARITKRMCRTWRLATKHGVLVEDGRYREVKILSFKYHRRPDRTRLDNFIPHLWAVFMATIRNRVASPSVLIALTPLTQITGNRSTYCSSIWTNTTRLV